MITDYIIDIMQGHFFWSEMFNMYIYKQISYRMHHSYRLVVIDCNLPDWSSFYLILVVSTLFL
jgi:hypothetical protein